MTFLFVIAPLMLAALITAAVRDIGESVVLASAAVAAFAYLITFVRRIFRAVDKLGELPGDMEALKRQNAEQAEQHEAAHVEMLSMVKVVDGKVADLAERLAVIERHADREHEHVQALTRELDVSVRGAGRDAA